MLRKGEGSLKNIEKMFQDFNGSQSIYIDPNRYGRIQKMPKDFA